ncbi:uncharacterized protein LOC128192914 [Crassostrea angulata]|uniref:uncharacterized protein LOC128192914 n=1 Tax=Magallana angulata TaxID=2784310 RepID=UPI0022B20BA2|nr:uncharacterized protein LOC128192914 [Crassostrea angulata]XP_052721945.1 uncharacterized protein LOC128192914 [Crassostrea angulata]
MQNFSCEEFTGLLRSSFVGRKIIYKDVTDTTMDDAKLGGLQGDPQGTIYISEIQNKARGTKDHKWVALNRGNLYLSMVIHLPPPIPHKSNVQTYLERYDLEVVGALALIRTLHEMSIPGACLKWPNDVWVKGHKIAGFLAEHGGPLPGSKEDKHLFVLGMGINVNSDMRRNPDLVGIATSIRCENGGVVSSREKVLAEVCNKVEFYLGLSHEDLFQEASKFLLFRAEQKVRVQPVLGGKMFSATVEELQEDWCIIVRDTNGQQVRCYSHDHSLRPMPSSAIYIYSGRMADSWKARLILNSLKSVVDTSQFFVDALNDEKLAEGVWQKDAVLMVIGELNPKESKAVENFAPIQKFTASGGSVLLIKSKTEQIFPNIVLPAQPLEQSGPLSEVYFCDKNFTALTMGSALTFNPDAESEVIGQYNSHDSGSPSAVLVKVGAGKCAVLGFNIEITYNDVDTVSNLTEIDKISDSLSKTIVTRDDYLNYVISFLIKR